MYIAVRIANKSIGQIIKVIVERGFVCMFKVGDRVECSLTFLEGHEGLWGALYPGRVVGSLDHQGMYWVNLDEFRYSILLRAHRLFPARTDIITGRYPRVGEQVHVLEYYGRVPVWWEATTTIALQKSPGYIRVVRRHSPWVDWVPLKNVRPKRPDPRSIIKMRALKKKLIERRKKPF